MIGTDMQRFANKVAIVTGGAGGIGFATASRLSSEGACVVIADINPKASDRIAELKRTGAADAIALVCNVADEENIQLTVDETIKRFGKLDVVINNAGAMTFKPIADLTLADWNKVLGIDLLGAAIFTRAAFGAMKPGGAIVNIASIHAERTSPLVAPYAAAKAALLSLTRTAALEGYALGIRVNAIEPGAIDTPMLWDNPNVKSGVEKIDKNDVGKPENIAAAAAYLASDDAAFITGTSLRVDGGRLARL